MNTRFSRTFLTRFSRFFIPPFCLNFWSKNDQKWPLFWVPIFWGSVNPQKWPKNGHFLTIFCGGAVPAYFQIKLTPKLAQNRAIFGGNFRTPPQKFRQGGMRKRKNAKNRGGKNKEKFDFLHFFVKNDHFYDFWAIFWSFLGPPKKGVKNDQKMTQKMEVIFYNFEMIFWMLKKIIQKNFFQKFFFQNWKHFFSKKIYNKINFFKKIKFLWFKNFYFFEKK